MNLTDHEPIPISEFDALVRAGEFANGPHVSTFGDGQGEPYNPFRDVWGTLRDGRKVRSETKADAGG
jgi:hypothetical protein